MQQGVFSDAEFLGSTQLNNAASVTTAGVEQDISVTHSAGLIAPSGVVVTASTLTYTFTIASTFATVFANGFIGYALGNTAGSTSNVYTVNLASFVPSSGSQLVYIVLSAATVQQGPFVVAGPPSGHPDFNPNFAPYTAYSSTANTLVITATTTVPDNAVYIELGRITLTAGQTSVTPMQFVTTYQVLAGSILANTGVTAATYTLLNGTVGADGRIYSASSANNVTIPGTLTVDGASVFVGAATFDSTIGASSSIYTGTYFSTGATGYINTGTGTSNFGGAVNISGGLNVGGAVTAGTTVSATTYMYAPFYATTGTGYVSVGSGASTINGTLVVAGAITSSGGNITSSVGTVTGVNVQFTNELYGPSFSVVGGNVSATSGTVTAAALTAYNGSTYGTFTGHLFNTDATGYLNIGTGASAIGGTLTVGGAAVFDAGVTFDAGVAVYGPLNAYDNASVTGSLTITNGSISGGWQCNAYGAGNPALVASVGLVAGTYGFTATAGWLYSASGPVAAPSGVTAQFGFSCGSGYVQGLGFAATSDIRLKENVADVTPEEGLRFVKTVKPITFDWKNAGGPGTGYVAQQLIAAGFDRVVTVIPDEGLEEAIHEYEGGDVTSLKGLRMIAKYDDTIAFLHAGLLGALSMIDAQKARIEALETLLTKDAPHE